MAKKITANPSGCAFYNPSPVVFLLSITSTTYRGIPICAAFIRDLSTASGSFTTPFYSKGTDRPQSWQRRINDFSQRPALPLHECVLPPHHASHRLTFAGNVSRDDEIPFSWQSPRLYGGIPLFDGLVVTRRCFALEPPKRRSRSARQGVGNGASSRSKM